MKTIKLLHTLLEYDFPQVFVANDAIGRRYICMVCDITERGHSFLCVPVSIERCEQLLTGKIDLRSVYETPEVSEFYTAIPDDLTAQFEISFLPSFQVSADLLPEPGLEFFFNDEVLVKAQELNATVAFASLSVPESKYEPRIRTRKLSAFLNIYQSVIKNLARASSKSMGKPIPKNEEPYESDVFGFCFGSFTVQVRSSDPCDMLGENKALIAAFQKLNEFLDAADNADNAVEFLLSVRGHAASSLLGLLNFIAENDCQLTNRWSTPGMSKSSQSKIRVASANNIIQRCRTRQDIGVETLELVGIVDSADVTAGAWKIYVEDVAYSGVVRDGSGVNLAGIILRDRYIFRCEERIEMLGTGREVRKIYLTGFEPASEI